MNTVKVRYWERGCILSQEEEAIVKAIVICQRSDIKSLVGFGRTPRPCAARTHLLRLNNTQNRRYTHPPPPPVIPPPFRLCPSLYNCLRERLMINRENPRKIQVWDHGRRNFKDTNPLMSSSLVILFGVVKQFCRFRIWSETECKTPAEYGPQYISTPHPPTVTHCLYILYIGKWGGGGRRSERRYSRGATVHKYSSFIHRGQQFTSRVEIQTMSECISSL
jgi:hypothetical protein